MARRLRIVLLSAIPVAALLLPLAVYAIARAVTDGEVPRGVSAAEIDLGGLSRDEATATLRSYEATLATTPLEYVVADQNFILEPRAIGFEIDEMSIVDAAFAQREEGFFSGFFDWITTDNDGVILQVEASYDATELDEQLDRWEVEAIAKPAFEGAIEIVDNVATATYPSAGLGIDRTGANEVTLTMIQGTARQPVQLTTRRVNPQLTRDDFDTAVDEINLLIGSPITLSTKDPEFEFTISAAELAASFLVDVTTNSATTIEFGFDEPALAAILEQYRPDLELPSQDAEFELVVVNGAKLVEMRPGRSASVLDLELALAAIDEAARTAKGVADLELAEGESAAFTTAEAEAMLPITKVSSWSTRYTPGQPRVKNIQLFADTVDEALIWPGNSFSLNAYVGQRTVSKGYVLAPMIEAGELIDSVGGGVSQFATTFYNAVFYGCYEDIIHKPHSYYFTRYPEVNEATISFPEPNLTFRNDSDAIIIIDTSYTSSTVTVSFWGNNGGCEVERALGGRFNFTQPQEQFEEDASVDPGKQIIEQGGAIGWSNTVTRTMTWPDGTVIEQEWFWRYRARPRIVRVHPCEIEGADEECPLLVPNVVGLKRAAAADQLRAAGFKVSIGDRIPVEDPKDNNRVLTQSVAGGEYLAEGGVITLQLGEYTEPLEE